MTIDKKWALNQIRHNRNTFIFSLGACHVLRSDATKMLSRVVVVCKDGNTIFSANDSDRIGKRYEIDLDQMAQEYTHHNTRFNETLKEFFKAQRRLVFKESFEITKAYADSVGAKASFKSQSWYQFCRIIRNSVSHNFHFQFNQYDLTVLPVSWEGVTIDVSLDGQHLQENHLPPDIVIKALIEWENFINTH